MINPREATIATEETDFLSAHAAPEGPAVAKLPLFLTVAAAALLIVGALVVLMFTIKNERVKLTENLQTRMNIAAQGRADIMRTWLDGKMGMGLRLTDSPTIRLITTEIDQQNKQSKSADAALVELPHVQTSVDAFAQQNKIAGAYLIARDGRAFLSASTAEPLSAPQRAAAQAVFDTGKTTFSPMRRVEGDVLIDMAQPIRALQAQVGQDVPAVTGALLLSFSAQALIDQLLDPGTQAAPGEMILLLQSAAADGGAEIISRKDGKIVMAAGGQDFASIRTLKFDARASLSGSEAVFSIVRAVPDGPWAILMELDQKQAMAPLETFRVVGGGITLLLLVCVIVAVFAIWLRGKSESNKALAEQYKNLATRINAHRDLLNGINRSIPEMIGVKDLNGRYIFANPYFVEAFGKAGERSVLDHTDDQLFPRRVAKIIEGLALKTLDSLVPERAELEMEVVGQRYYFSVTANPFTSEDGERIGVLTVLQDVTEIRDLHEAQRRQTEQTIEALVTTIEQADPHLVGHSARIARLADGVAEHLGYSVEERDVLKQASMLSQIGKIYVPREILTKTERLSDEEFELMKQHVAHTLKTVRRLEISDDVYETLNHMHERLDGSGYPANLSGEDISRLGLVLAVADVFAARTASRGYRPAISIDDTLQILDQNSDKYAPEVIDALRAFVNAHPEKAADQT